MNTDGNGQIDKKLISEAKRCLLLFPDFLFELIIYLGDRVKNQKKQLCCFRFLTPSELRVTHKGKNCEEQILQSVSRPSVGRASSSREAYMRAQMLLPLG